MEYVNISIYRFPDAPALFQSKDLNTSTRDFHHFPTAALSLRRHLLLSTLPNLDPVLIQQTLALADETTP